MSILERTLTPSAPAAIDMSAEIMQLLYIFRKFWRLIALTTVVSLTLAAIYLAKTKAIYQAEARLLVLQQGGRPLNVGNAEGARNQGNVIEDFVPTHMQLLASPEVVRQAIEDVGLDQLPTLNAVKRAGSDPVAAAIERLRVSRPDRVAKIVSLEYRAGDRFETVRMIRAITESYKRFLEKTFQKDSKNVITLIDKAREDLEKELVDLERQYLDLRRNAPVFVTSGEHPQTFSAARLSHWDHAISESGVKAAQLKAQLDLGRKLSQEGAELWAIAHAMSHLGGESPNLSNLIAAPGAQAGASEFLRQLLLEQQQLVDRFGPSNIRVREIQRQVDAIRARVRASRSSKDGGDVGELLRSIETTQTSVLEMQNELSRQFKKDEELARKDEAALIDEQNLRNRLERGRALYNSVVEQLKQAQFVSDYSSITSHVVAPPKMPRNPVWPRTSMTLGLALVMGALAGMVTAVLADRSDQRIRSLDELRQITGLPVLGRVMQVPTNQKALISGVGLISHLKPRSSWAEAYRVLRTNLDFIRRTQTLKVIIITSPNAGDGKSTSASNLAVSLAVTGRKVLLVDADMRKPTQQAIFAIEQEGGLSTLLKAGPPLSRVVQRPGIGNLEVITSGPEVSNPAELLASPRLEEIIEEARALYDIVIIDAPPILAVADASIVGAIADGVILVIKALGLNRNDCVRTLELLQILGTPVLGMLVNGIGQETMGYGYGYGYGYGNKEEDSKTLIPLEGLDRAGERPDKLTDVLANGKAEHESHGDLV